jgi:GT2 family glycosyltransferase
MDKKVKIRLVVASRYSREEFLNNSALGQNRLILSRNNIEVRLFPNNQQGLSKVYNQAIRESEVDPAVLVFIHDDLWITDCFIRQRLLDGLEQFHLIGLAGSTKRESGQPSWFFKSQTFQKVPATELSGTVGHGNAFPPTNVSVYGPSPKPVKLLDGLFLACKSKTLFANNIKFDERFDFHFYDMDLCRQFEAMSLKMGTWPISTVHQSGGKFSVEWRKNYLKYISKWKE